MELEMKFGIRWIQWKEVICNPIQRATLLIKKALSKLIPLKFSISRILIKHENSKLVFPLLDFFKSIVFKKLNA